MTYTGIVKCLRCPKEIVHPDSSNADYIIAQDTVAREPREILFALKHNQATLAKTAKMKETETYLADDGVTKLTRLKYPDLKIADSEYARVEVPYMEAAKGIGEDLVKVIARVEERDIQKTGIICPDCYKPTDFVIWGVHKK